MGVIAYYLPKIKNNRFLQIKKKKFVVVWLRHYESCIKADFEVSIIQIY